MYQGGSHYKFFFFIFNNSSNSKHFSNRLYFIFLGLRPLQVIKKCTFIFFDRSYHNYFTLRRFNLNCILLFLQLKQHFNSFFRFSNIPIFLNYVFWSIYLSLLSHFKIFLFSRFGHILFKKKIILIFEFFLFLCKKQKIDLKLKIQGQCLELLY